MTIIPVNEADLEIEMKKAFKNRQSRPKSTWEVTIHQGLSWHNFRLVVKAHRWFTAVDKTVLAYAKERKEMPRRLLISVKKK